MKQSIYQKALLPIFAKVSTAANLKTLYFDHEEVCFPHLEGGVNEKNVLS